MTKTNDSKNVEKKVLSFVFVKILMFFNFLLSLVFVKIKKKKNPWSLPRNQSTGASLDHRNSSIWDKNGIFTWLLLYQIKYLLEYLLKWTYTYMVIFLYIVAAQCWFLGYKICNSSCSLFIHFAPVLLYDFSVDQYFRQKWNLHLIASLSNYLFTWISFEMNI